MIPLRPTVSAEVTHVGIFSWNSAGSGALSDSTHVPVPGTAGV